MLGAWERNPWIDLSCFTSNHIYGYRWWWWWEIMPLLGGKRNAICKYINNDLRCSLWSPLSFPLQIYQQSMLSFGLSTAVDDKKKMDLLFFSTLIAFSLIDAKHKITKRTILFIKKKMLRKHPKLHKVRLYDVRHWKINNGM